MRRYLRDSLILMIVTYASKTAPEAGDDPIALFNTSLSSAVTYPLYSSL